MTLLFLLLALIAATLLFGAAVVRGFLGVGGVWATISIDNEKRRNDEMRTRHEKQRLARQEAELEAKRNPSKERRKYLKDTYKSDHP